MTRYRVKRFSVITEEERLYAVNWRLLGSDLKKTFLRKKGLVSTAKTLAEPFHSDGKEIVQLAKDVASSRRLVKKVLPGRGGFVRNLKAGIIRKKRLLRDLKEGTAETVSRSTDHVGGLYDRADRLGTKLVNYGVNTWQFHPNYYLKRLSLNLSKKLGVRDVASPTGAYELYRKRLGQAADVLFKNREGHKKGVGSIRRFLADPGSALSKRGREYIKTGGDKVLDDYVLLDKALTHARAVGGSPIDIINAGTGFYTGDLNRTFIRTGATALDKGLNRYVTVGGKPIRLGARYRAGARKLGDLYGRYLERPVAKVLNTGSAAAQAATTGVMPAHVYTGAPMMTGDTGRKIAEGMRNRFGSIMSKVTPQVA